MARIYTTEEIEKGLWALALNAGSPTAASDMCGISKQQLHRWKTTHAQRYAEVQEQAQGPIIQRIAAAAEAFMIRATETEALILEKLHAAIQNGEVEGRDLPNALRNVTTSKALNNDKIASPLRGRPTIVEHRHTGDEALQRLVKLGVVDLDASAVVELPDETQAQIEA